MEDDLTRLNDLAKTLGETLDKMEKAATAEEWKELDAKRKTAHIKILAKGSKEVIRDHAAGVGAVLTRPIPPCPQ